MANSYAKVSYSMVYRITVDLARVVFKGVHIHHNVQVRNGSMGGIRDYCHADKS
jgi:hypothetical protein